MTKGIIEKGINSCIKKSAWGVTIRESVDKVNYKTNLPVLNLKSQLNDAFYDIDFSLNEHYFCIMELEYSFNVQIINKDYFIIPINNHNLLKVAVGKLLFIRRDISTGNDVQNVTI